MQRTLIIATIGIVLVGIGVGVYFYFFSNAPSVEVAPGESASLPVAGQSVPIPETTPDALNTPVDAPVILSPRLVQISKGPVVPGAVAVNIKALNASSSPDVAITYIERQSGNVFSYLTNAKKLTRTSNRTVPGIQSAAWLPNGSTAYVRYLSGDTFSTINTYALSASSTEGFFLPQNLVDVAVSSTSVLTLASGVSGSTASLSRTDGTRAVTAFTSPLSSLRISFLGKSGYLAVTKPSAALSGDAFLVDATGRFSRISGPRNGLVALASPSGKWVLVSYTLDTAMQMELVNISTGETLPLPVATIADKCVWTLDESAIYCGIPVNPPTGASYPDDWYQGAVHFSDRIWKIQVDGRYAQLFLDFSKETEFLLDAEALVVDPSNMVLAFVNKNDGSFWSYSL